MRVRITDRNEASVQVAQTKWNYIPMLDDWHLAIGYNGTETTPDKLPIAVSFVQRGDCLMLEDWSVQPVTTHTLAAVLQSIAQYGVDNDVTYVVFTVGAKTEFRAAFDIMNIRPIQIVGDYLADGAERFACIMKGFPDVPQLRVLPKDFKTEMLASLTQVARHEVVDMVSAVCMRSEYLYGYYLGTKLAGIVAFNTDMFMPKQAGKMVTYCYVKPEYRRQGIGTTLMKFARSCTGGAARILCHFDNDEEFYFVQHIGAAYSFFNYRQSSTELLQKCKRFTEQE